MKAHLASVGLALLSLAFALSAQLANQDRLKSVPQGCNEATFYLVDIGHGNVAFVISPSGETMLLDCGPTYTLNKITNFMQQHDIRRIGYLVIGHFETPANVLLAGLRRYWAQLIAPLHSRPLLCHPHI